MHLSLLDSSDSSSSDFYLVLSHLPLVGRAFNSPYEFIPGKLWNSHFPRRNQLSKKACLLDLSTLSTEFSTMLPTFGFTITFTDGIDHFAFSLKKGINLLQRGILPIRKPIQWQPVKVMTPQKGNEYDQGCAAANHRGERYRESIF